MSVPDCIVDGVDGCSEGMIYEKYPLFIDTLNNDFRLLGCSPAVNAGNNDFLNPDNIFDLNQQMRVLDSIVDMGAYEQMAIDIEINYTVQNATTVSSLDGSISIDTIGGGIMPYSFYWENGDTTSNLNNINAGNYSLTITDSNGCEKVFVFEVSATNATSDFFDFFDIPIYPNPVDNVVNIDLSKVNETAELFFYNNRGQIIYEAEVRAAIKQINVANFYSGVYYLKIRIGEFLMIKKIIVN